MYAPDSCGDGLGAVRRGSTARVEKTLMLSVIARDNIRRPFLLATLITMTFWSSGTGATSACLITTSRLYWRRMWRRASLVGGGIETVTVSAQKREENIQDVPQAITAIRGSDVDRHADLLSPTDLGRSGAEFLGPIQQWPQLRNRAGSSAAWAPTIRR